MANYLQRVIMAGGRKRSSARPPIAVSAVVPTIAAPLSLTGGRPIEADISSKRPSSQPRQTTSTAAPDPTEPLATEHRVAHAEERLWNAPPKLVPTPVKPATEKATFQADEHPLESALTPIVEAPAEPATQPPVPLSVAIARMISSSRIVAPKALRPQNAITPIFKVSSIEVTNVMALAGLGNRAVMSQPSPAAAPSRTATPLATEAPAKSGDTTLGVAAAPPPKFAPRHLNPQEIAPVSSAPTEPEPSPPTAKAIGKESIIASEPQARSDRITKAEAPAESWSSTQPAEASPAPPLQLQATAGTAPPSQAVGIKPKLLEPPPIAMPERGHTRPSRIIIGKVDVQVTNHRPAPAKAADHVPAFAAPSGSVETFYLERFSMRP